ncbi:MAG: LptF/LptG family permease [Tepidisphaeraceae bacterium]|jgi:lipopolysaccharide export LptBFGC system permease protein LptF
MSKTLFWYIFWPLLRVFAMATCALAVMMSFAGLLRPLTENGLDMRQVNQMLLYLTPAMSTYSLPVAALFAATIVYGRFASDNELTAMRAGGVSYLSLRGFSIAMPALVLGLTVATISLIMLCFVVPIFSLRVQEIIYSNIAKVIASDIERDHEVDFAGMGGSWHVFAEEARLQPADPNQPLVQRVELIGPAIVTYQSPDPAAPDMLIPRDFSLARSAMVTIQRSGEGKPWGDLAVPMATLTVHLTDGLKFPREFYGNVQAGVEDTTFGPVDIPSPIHENVKFLDVKRLTELAENPGSGERVQNILADVIQREQEAKCLDEIARQINLGEESGYRFPSEAESDTFRIGGNGATAVNAGGELIVTAPARGDQTRTVWMEQAHGSQVTLRAEAKEIRVRAKPDRLAHRVTISIELYDTLLHTQEGPSERLSFIRSFSEAMAPDVRAVESKTLADFQSDPEITANDAMWLHHEEVAVNNSARSELHGRASFAVSCLILVMIGCGLGTVFKSGNMLNAFAVSFVPALLSITLIFCGQQAATHVPFDMGAAFHDPLPTGIAFIWGGNLVVLAGAIYLTMRLQQR